MTIFYFWSHLMSFSDFLFVISSFISLLRCVNRVMFILLPACHSKDCNWRVVQCACAVENSRSYYGLTLVTSSKEDGTYSAVHTSKAETYVNSAGMPPKRVRKAIQTRAWVTTFHSSEESGTEKATSSQKGILKKDTPSEKDSEDTRSLSSDTTQCSSVSSECSSPLSSDDDKKKKRKTKKRLKKEKAKTSKKIKDKDYQRGKNVTNLSFI
nr:uncharacterized protein LOC129154740 [Nothobranchius furzeri]